MSASNLFPFLKPRFNRKANFLWSLRSVLFLSHTCLTRYTRIFCFPEKPSVWLPAALPLLVFLAPGMQLWWMLSALPARPLSSEPQGSRQIFQQHFPHRQSRTEEVFQTHAFRTTGLCAPICTTFSKFCPLLSHWEVQTCYLLPSSR